MTKDIFLGRSGEQGIELFSLETGETSRMVDPSTLSGGTLWMSEGTPTPVPCTPAPPRSTGRDQWASAPLTQSTPPAQTEGEEVLLHAALQAQPKFDGVIVTCLWRSGWFHVSAEEIVSFAQAETPTLFAALGQEPQVGNAFEAALTETLSRPAGLAQALSSARLSDSPDAVYTGALLGAELAAMKPYWLGQPVWMIAREPWAEAYQQALAAQGVPVTLSDPVALMSRL